MSFVFVQGRPRKNKNRFELHFFFVKSLLFCSYVQTQDDACFANDTLLANNSICCDHQASKNTSLKSSRKWNSLPPWVYHVTVRANWAYLCAQTYYSLQSIWYFVQKRLWKLFSTTTTFCNLLLLSDGNVLMQFSFYGISCWNIGRDTNNFFSGSLDEGKLQEIGTLITCSFATLHKMPSF